MSEADVREKFRKRDVSISAIEPLKSGGTHVVCTTIEGAAEIRRRLRSHLIEGPVQRFPFYHAGHSW
ncbi:MAG TPA: hypothetical protein VJM34_17410 [Novosphingobium sp.]|nr:hypothetical protein [Novosphingobium sp.]